MNVQNDTGNTAIHYAALNGKEEIVKLLLAAGADVNVKNEFGRLPIEDALQGGKPDIAEILAPQSKLDEEKVYSQFNPPENDADVAGADELFEVEET